MKERTSISTGSGSPLLPNQESTQRFFMPKPSLSGESMASDPTPNELLYRRWNHLADNYYAFEVIACSTNQKGTQAMYRLKELRMSLPSEYDYFNGYCRADRYNYHLGIALKFHQFNIDKPLFYQRDSQAEVMELNMTRKKALQKRAIETALQNLTKEQVEACYVDLEEYANKKVELIDNPNSSFEKFISLPSHYSIFKLREIIFDSPPLESLEDSKDIGPTLAYLEEYYFCDLNGCKEHTICDNDYEVSLFGELSVFSFEKVSDLGSLETVRLPSSKPNEFVLTLPLPRKASIDQFECEQSPKAVTSTRIHCINTEGNSPDRPCSPFLPNHRNIGIHVKLKRNDVLLTSEKFAKDGYAQRIVAARRQRPEKSSHNYCSTQAPKINMLYVCKSPEKMSERVYSKLPPTSAFNLEENSPLVRTRLHTRQTTQVRKASSQLQSPLKINMGSFVLKTTDRDIVTSPKERLLRGTSGPLGFKPNQEINNTSIDYLTSRRQLQYKHPTVQTKEELSVRVPDKESSVHQAFHCKQKFSVVSSRGSKRQVSSKPVQRSLFEEVIPPKRPEMKISQTLKKSIMTKMVQNRQDILSMYLNPVKKEEASPLKPRLCLAAALPNQAIKRSRVIKSLYKEFVSFNPS